MAAALLVIAVIVIGGFVLLVSMRYRQEQARQGGWAAEAARLGLDYAKGDPLGLASRLRVRSVDETVSGTVDGARVAAVTVSDVREFSSTEASGRTEWYTWSVGVALDGDAVVDREPRGPHLTHAPVKASELEGLLRETAQAAARPSAS